MEKFFIKKRKSYFQLKTERTSPPKCDFYSPVKFTGLHTLKKYQTNYIGSTFVNTYTHRKNAPRNSHWIARPYGSPPLALQASIFWNRTSRHRLAWAARGQDDSFHRYFSFLIKTPWRETPTRRAVNALSVLTRQRSKVKMPSDRLPINSCLAECQ